MIPLVKWFFMVLMRLLFYAFAASKLSRFLRLSGSEIWALKAIFNLQFRFVFYSILMLYISSFFANLFV